MAQWNNYGYNEEPYNAPSWCSKLINVPKTRIKLAHVPTPIHKWNLPGAPEHVNIYIKRDDLTGSTLTGNKVRKLEFLLSDAVNQGCKHIITCGCLQSNHVRTTAAAAAQIGVKCHLVVSSIPDGTPIKSLDPLDLSSGNLFLDCMFGSNIYATPFDCRYYDAAMQHIAQKIRKDHLEESYIIPLGGSNKVGMFGYIDCYEEMLSQGILDHITDIVVACGSGGTADGLALANYLAGSDIRIHGIPVAFDAAGFYKLMNDTFQEVGVTEVKAEDCIDIIDGYVGEGYGISQPKDLEFIQEVSEKTGIVLEPSYTGKTALGLVKELENNPGRFKGNNILFIHTGGIFGAMDGRLAKLFTSPQSMGNLYYLNDFKMNN